MTEPRYDLAIIGAGASGLIAAAFAVKLGARVALLEKDRIGGDCTWSGCVPSKSLIKCASVAQGVRTAARYGIDSGKGVTDMSRVRDYLNSTIAHIYVPTMPDALRAKGMDVLMGAVSFVDSHMLETGAGRIYAKKILINTGAHPVTPGIDGLADVPYSTYLNIFENDRLPDRMLVIGGGPIGCEVAQAYQRLGAQVTLVAEKLLPLEDEAASEVLEAVFATEGVTRIRSRATAVRMEGGAIRVSTQEGEIAGDLLFVATGRGPSVDGLNLEAAGVLHSAKGIAVNRYLQTLASHIYATGDVIGGPQFSHLAGWQGFQAARNALLPGRSVGIPKAMPRATFTSPEVAQVGMTEREARARYGDQLRIDSLDMARVDRAVSEDDQRGFLKIIARPDGSVVGATIIGERASEAITELVIAIDRGYKVQEIASVVHPYPTYSIGVQFLATKMAMTESFSGSKGRLLRAVSRLYR